jgi:hypothetical protein
MVTPGHLFFQVSVGTSGMLLLSCDRRLSLQFVWFNECFVPFLILVAANCYSFRQCIICD